MRLQHRLNGGQGTINFFLLLCPLTWQWADILQGSERTICHCRQRHTVLPCQLSSRCNSIQLLYTLRIRGRAGGMRVCICVFVCGMIEWGVCAPWPPACVCEKARDKVGEHCVGVLYSGNNVSEKKKGPREKSPSNQGAEKRVFLASLNTSTWAAPQRGPVLQALKTIHWGLNTVQT